jgi:hypothetical protein
MSGEDPAARRVRFYGAADLATYWQAGRAAERPQPERCRTRWRFRAGLGDGGPT